MTNQDRKLDAIKEMSVEEFERLIREHLTDDELWDLLMDPSVLSRTAQVLSAVYVDVESQLSARRTKMDESLTELRRFKHECLQRGEQGKRDFFQRQYEVDNDQARYEDWRARALSYYRMVKNRQSQVKLHRQAQTAQNGTAAPSARPQPNIEKRNMNFNSLFELAYAVRKHQQRCEELDLTPEAHDLKLWARLDELTIYTASGGAIPLGDFVEQVAQRPDFEPRPGM